MSIYDKAPPSTSDPRQISDFLFEQYEYLIYIFSNIDEENLSDALYSKINSLSDRLNTLEDKMNSVMTTSVTEEG